MIRPISKRYKEIATKYNLLISGGSDYHGPNVKPNVKLGYINNEDLPTFGIPITITRSGFPTIPFAR